MAVGFVALGIVGVGIGVVLTPRQGSVEYHKREYLSAWNGATEPTFAERIKRIYHKVTGRGPVPVAWGSREEELMAKFRSHRGALVRLGYLVDRKFALTNANASDVQVAILIEYDGTDAMTKAFVSLKGTEDVLDVTAPVFELQRLEEIVREADAPKRADGR